MMASVGLERTQAEPAVCRSPLPGAAATSRMAGMSTAMARFRFPWFARRAWQPTLSYAVGTPDQQYPPLRSAEPPPATQTQRDELTLAVHGNC
jgi:hypothetical protein